MATSPSKMRRYEWPAGVDPTAVTRGVAAVQKAFGDGWPEVSLRAVVGAVLLDQAAGGRDEPAVAADNAASEPPSPDPR